MPKISTPSLVYFTMDDNAEQVPFRDVERAVAVAAARSFHTGKTASAYVYIRETVRHRVQGRLPDGDPVSVLYVKVTDAPWKS
jgi:hypothetical protein